MGFLLLMAGLIYLDGTKLFLQILAACVLHEAGHYGAVLLVGSKVHSLRLTVIGAEMKLAPEISLSYMQDALVAFLGPCVNLLLAWISICAGTHLFAGINLCFGILNLLPIYPLDGARILSCVLSYFWPATAEKLIQAVSTVFSGALLGLGWAAWRGWGNLSLLLTAAWLTAGVIKGKNKSDKAADRQGNYKLFETISKKKLAFWKSLW